MNEDSKDKKSDMTRMEKDGHRNTHSHEGRGVHCQLQRHLAFLNEDNKKTAIVIFLWCPRQEK